MDDVQEGSENNGPEELLSETTIGLTTNMEIESKFELPSVNFAISTTMPIGRKEIGCKL